MPELINIESVQVIVINQIPFILETPAPDIGVDFSTTWHRGCWKPFLGFNSGTESLKSVPPKQNNTFKDELEYFFSKMDFTPDSKMIEAINALLPRNKPIGIDLTTSDYSNLAEVFLMFGSMQALKFSMASLGLEASTSLPWNTNAFLKLFKKELNLITVNVSNNYPLINLKDINLSANSVSYELNARILTEIKLQQPPLSRNNNIALVTITGLGITSGIMGGLILGGVIECSLGLGGAAVVGSLTMAASCTGFGLIAAAVVLFTAAIIYYLYTTQVKDEVAQDAQRFLNTHSKEPKPLLSHLCPSRFFYPRPSGAVTQPSPDPIKDKPQVIIAENKPKPSAINFEFYPPGDVGSDPNNKFEDEYGPTII